MAFSGSVLGTGMAGGEEEVGKGLHSFPRVTVTRDHKLGSLKPHRSILSQFSRPDVQSQGVGRVGSFWRPRGGSQASLLAPSVARGSWHPLAYRGTHHSSLCPRTPWPPPPCDPVRAPFLSLVRTVFPGSRARPPFRVSSSPHLHTCKGSFPNKLTCVDFRDGT